ncbi:hypothetical protein [Pedobacter steynii]
MKDLVTRFLENPLLMPQDLKASRESLQIISLLNSGGNIFNCTCQAVKKLGGITSGFANHSMDNIGSIISVC